MRPEKADSFKVCPHRHTLPPVTTTPPIDGINFTAACSKDVKVTLKYRHLAGHPNEVFRQGQGAPDQRSVHHRAGRRACCGHGQLAASRRFPCSDSTALELRFLGVRHAGVACTGGRFRAMGGLAVRESYGERRATLRGMAGVDRPTKTSHQRADEGQAYAGADLPYAAVALVQHGAIEGDGQVSLGEARATVAHRDHRSSRRSGGRGLADKPSESTIGAPAGVTRKAFSASPSTTCRMRVASVRTSTGPGRKLHREPHPHRGNNAPTTHLRRPGL